MLNFIYSTLPQESKYKKEGNLSLKFVFVHPIFPHRSLTATTMSSTPSHLSPQMNAGSARLEAAIGIVENAHTLPDKPK